MGEGNQIPMTPQIAVDVLLKMASKLEVDVEDWQLVLCSDMGTKDAQVSVGSAQQISSVLGGANSLFAHPSRVTRCGGGCTCKMVSCSPEA